MVATSWYAPRSGARRTPKGLMPFGYPQREKSFRYRSTHFFAKRYVFSLCVCKLKKLANTKDARKRDGKSFCYPRRTPVQLIFQQKRGYPSACRAWWLYGERCIERLYVFLPSPLCRAARNKAENDSLLAVATESLDFVAQKLQMPQRLLVTTKR